MTGRLHIIAYDISHPARLRRVHRLLHAVGAWHQLSVFLVRMSASRKAELIERLRKEIDLQQDRLLIAPLCGEDTGEILCLGKAEPFPGPKVVIL